MKHSLLAVAACAACPTLAFADDPKFTYGKAEEVKGVTGPDWLASAEAGGMLTNGNSNTTTISAGLRATRKDGDNKLAIEGSFAYVKTAVRVLQDLNGNGLIDNNQEIVNAESVTAETMNGKLRYDRFLTESNSLYIAALALRDVPAGKLSVFGGQFGYSRQLYKDKTTETVAEIGYDFSREHDVSGPAIEIHSARGFVGHKAALGEGVALDAALEVLTNLNHETLSTMKDGSAFQDTRVNFKVALSAKIGRNLAVQTTIEAHYDNRPAPLSIKMLAPGSVPEAEPLDTIMKASLIYTFVGTETKK